MALGARFESLRLGLGKAYGNLALPKVLATLTMVLSSGFCCVDGGVGAVAGIGLAVGAPAAAAPVAAAPVESLDSLPESVSPATTVPSFSTLAERLVPSDSMVTVPLAPVP